MRRTYKNKLEYSKQQHEKIKWWYEENFYKYEIVESELIQRYTDIDLIVVDNDKKGWFIEEKLVPKYHDKIAIEVIQNGFSGNLGWIHCCKADIMVFHYCPPDLSHTRSYWFSFPALKDFYRRRKNDLPHRTYTTGECSLTHPTLCLYPWKKLSQEIEISYYEIEYKEER